MKDHDTCGEEREGRSVGRREVLGTFGTDRCRFESNLSGGQGRVQRCRPFGTHSNASRQAPSRTRGSLVSRGCRQGLLPGTVAAARAPRPPAGRLLTATVRKGVDNPWDNCRRSRPASLGAGCLKNGHGWRPWHKAPHAPEPHRGGVWAREGWRQRAGLRPQPRWGCAACRYPRSPPRRRPRAAARPGAGGQSPHRQACR